VYFPRAFEPDPGGLKIILKFDENVVQPNPSLTGMQSCTYSLLFHKDCCHLESTTLGVREETKNWVRSANIVTSIV
jgi:hypothetical protein